MKQIRTFSGEIVPRKIPTTCASTSLLSDEFSYHGATNDGRTAHPGGAIHIGNREPVPLAPDDGTKESRLYPPVFELRKHSIVR